MVKKATFNNNFSVLHRKRQSMIKPKLSLRVIFIVPFLIIIILATGIGSFFSLRYGQQSVDEMVSQLQHEIATNVYEHLQDFHAIPSAIVEGNARSIRNGILDLDNPSTLERHFWNQVHIFQGVSPIYMGYAQGGIEMAIWREVEETGRLGKVVKIITSMGKEADAQYMYLTDDFGNRLELVETHPNYDVRNRPWFKAAVERREAGWSPVFTNFAGDALVISRNKPVYGDKGELLAVLCADLNLTHISDFLRGLTIGKTGRAFIIEQSGAVVATSAQEEPLRKQKGDAKPYRINSGESDDPLIRTAARYLMASSWIKDGMTRQAVFERHGKKLMLKVKPFNLENGPDWFIVVVIPMSDFMASINKNRWVTFFLISIAMIFSSVIGFLLADWLTKPIRKLSLAANAATQDEWVQIPETARGNELGELIQAFNQMILQLKDSFGQLRESDDRYKAFMKNSTEQIWCAEFDEPIDIDLPEDEQFELVYKHGYMAEANDAYARSVGFEHGEGAII
jgi:HAMP domain-containing protein